MCSCDVFQSRFLFTSFSNASVFFLNCCYVFNLGMGIGFQAKGAVVILFTVTCSYSCISYRCMILMITQRQIECIVNTYALEYILACSIYASRQAETIAQILINTLQIDCNLNLS